MKSLEAVFAKVQGRIEGQRDLKPLLTEMAEALKGVRGILTKGNFMTPKLLAADRALRKFDELSIP
jgi:hypothetical protein